MQITKKVIDKIDGHEVVLLKFVNDNNYSAEFCNFGGYFFSINIPKKNDPAQTEDVLLGYSSFNNYQKDNINLNAIVGRVCGCIANSQFKLNKDNVDKMIFFFMISYVLDLLN